MNGVRRDRFFTTGEFAALCGVTRHTLFHYDAMGILSPAAVGENGYRYYAAAQLDVFFVISTLRDLDMPLSEIRAYLDRRSPAALAGLLEQEDALLGAQIARLRQVQALVRRRAALTRQAMALDFRAITLETEGARLLVSTPVPPLTSERRIAEAIGDHIRYCRSLGVVSPYSIGSILPRSAAERGDFTAYTHFYTQTDRPPRGFKGEALVQVPAGRVLAACHTGGYATVEKTYRRLLAEGADRRLVLGDRFCEDVILDELASAGEENYVLRISIRVLEEGETAHE